MRVGERPLDPSLQVELSTGRRFKHDPCVSSVFIGRRRPYHTLSRLEQEDLLRLSVGLFLENTNNKKRRKPIVSRVRELVRGLSGASTAGWMRPPRSSACKLNGCGR